MNTYHRYSFTKKGKSICPACEKRRFVLYIDNETGNPLHLTVGKCDRSDNCGYHYTPKQYFADNSISFDRKEFVARPQPKPKSQPSFIDAELFKKSLQRYENNNLIQYLSMVAGTDAANAAINRYFVGTSKHWNGSTIFWQIDTQGKIRTGKIMQYNSDTGKRIKEPNNKIGWAHNVEVILTFHILMNQSTEGNVL